MNTSENAPETAPAPAVHLRSGNLFDSKARTHVITVNCVGVMGKGVALEAKKRYPDLFRTYEQMCSRGEMRLGRPVFIPSLVGPSFLLFPTKDHWRSVSKLSDIEQGLAYLREQSSRWGLKSLAVPPLGCGNGGLEWGVVGPILVEGLSKLGVEVELFVPSGVTPSDAEMASLQRAVHHHDIQRATETSPPEAVAIVLALRRVLELNPKANVGRILFQKMVFFAQVAGIPVPVTFVRGTYGPYSAEWTRSVRHLVNNGLLNETPLKGRDALLYSPGPTLAEYSRRLTSEVSKYEAAIERLASVFSRFNVDQAELAATALMVARESPNFLDENIVDAVLHWKRRRAKPFAEDRVRTCVAWLRSEKWVANPR